LALFVIAISRRESGDRNAGVENVYRNISHRAGIAVMVADVSKGAIVILVAQALGSQALSH